MVTDSEVLAIIPANSLSEAGDQHFTRRLGAHPLIAYTIAAATKAAHVKRTLVATGSQAVAGIAREYGSDIPFMLPPGPAFNSADDWTLLSHVLEQLAEKQSFRPELVVWLHPDAPIRPTDCIDQSIEILQADPLVQGVHTVVPAGAAVISTWKISLRGEVTSTSGQDFLADPSGVAVDKQTYFQTRHVSAIRIGAARYGSVSGGQVNRPMILDARYNIDVSNPFGWEWADWVIRHTHLDMVHPGKQPRPLPERVSLLVMDFDGVMTDNRVWVDEAGHERVAAYRGDSLGLTKLKKSGVDTLVLSTEMNPVVAQRCRKLNLPVIQGISDKAATLVALLSERRVNPSQVVYLGNDVNDLPCFPLVGYAVVPADAHPNAMYQADLVLSYTGGHGAIRELCDLLAGED